MITIQEWKSMSCKEQTLWLEKNTALSKKSIAYRNPIFGFGITDVSYTTRTKIDGAEVSCPAYRKWVSMMKRVLCQNYLSKNPTYHDVSICDDWRSFSSFRSWWLDNCHDGYDLDKDLLGGGKTYSPSTCVFVPKWLNNLALGNDARRGNYKIGASLHKGNGAFESRCSNPSTKKCEFLGYFKTQEAAHLAWRTRKLELSLELKPKMDEIDLRIYPRVIEIINNAK